MKLSYTKQLRPMVVGPMLPGFRQDYYPLYGAYTWFDEKDVTKDTERQWEEDVKKQDPLGTMEIQIRYVFSNNDSKYKRWNDRSQRNS